MQTPQQKMQCKLEEVGLPFKEIKVYGSQIMITSLCRSTAESWSQVLARFAKVRVAAKACLDDAALNKGTVLMPSKVHVWRTWATVK